MKDSSTQHPMDALSGKKMKFAYRPSKIWRSTYKRQPHDKAAAKFVPAFMLDPYRIDVSSRYFPTHKVVVSGYPDIMKKHKDLPYGLICVFDKGSLAPVHYGKANRKGFTFDNMIGNLCYIVAYRTNGQLIPATDPFILREDGTIRYLKVVKYKKQSMTLKRKYPRFERMKQHARKLQRAKAEGANKATFDDAVTLLTVGNIPGDINDSTVRCNKKFRYVRWKMQDNHSGNVAEVAFYGKKNMTDKELLLRGKIVGSPIPTRTTQHPYFHAMDGDPSTYFDKRVDEHSYVGLDLGVGNEAYVTRIKFHPQSDTNFILPGHTYELCFWEKNHWVKVGRKVAREHWVKFDGAPTDGLYILHNLTKGNEERVFTYENGKQIWW